MHVLRGDQLTPSVPLGPRLLLRELSDFLEYHLRECALDLLSCSLHLIDGGRLVIEPRLYIFHRGRLVVFVIAASLGALAFHRGGACLWEDMMLLVRYRRGGGLGEV